MLIVSTIFDVVILLFVCVAILFLGIIPFRKLLQCIIRIPSIVRFFGLSRKQRLLLRLFGSVVYADNDGEKSEIVVAKRYMESLLHVDPKVGEDFMFIHMGKSSCVDICGELLQCTKMSYGERLSLMNVLFSIAYVHVNVNRAEYEVLLEIANAMEITPWDRVSLEYQFEYRICFEKDKNREQEGKTGPRKRKGKKQSTSGKETPKSDANRPRESVPSEQIAKSRMSQAYEVLGLPDKSNEEEVRKAYHALVKQCHPDMLPDNVNDATREKALIRFREIHEAYKFLCEVICEVNR